jgi:hypothetical protein
VLLACALFSFFFVVVVLSCFPFPFKPIYFSPPYLLSVKIVPQARRRFGREDGRGQRGKVSGAAAAAAAALNLCSNDHELRHFACCPARSRPQSVSRTERHQCSVVCSVLTLSPAWGDVLLGASVEQKNKSVHDKLLFAKR